MEPVERRTWMAVPRMLGGKLARAGWAPGRRSPWPTGCSSVAGSKGSRRWVSPAALRFLTRCSRCWDLMSG